jgi:3-phosphoshikimate 1-carboxyvinyltransferase
MTKPAENTYPEQLEIRPLEHRPHFVSRIPGSKSITNRALVLAALASPPDEERHLSGGSWSCLTGALRSEDTEVMVDCLTRLGIRFFEDWPPGTHIEGKYGPVITVQAGDGIFPVDRADLFVANSGTTMRFLTAMVSLGHGHFRLDGIPRMRERPIQDLLDALNQLGVAAYSEHGNGCPPVVVEAGGIPGGHVTIKGDVSSQFLSGLLMAAPLALQEVEIRIQGPLVSAPYVAMTVEMMREFGARVEVHGDQRFVIPGQQRYRARRYDIEPDASAASYFAGVAAICGGAITLLDLAERSLQGDMRFLDVLREMGCGMRWIHEGATIRGGDLHGIELDMNDISDTVMTLAVVACFAKGPTTIRNVAHIRHKETDRLTALATELRRIGAVVEEFPDGLRIHPQPLHGAEIETYNDHRMAMSFALVGLRVPGIVIKNPSCVAKTYPDFFKDLEKLR